MSPQMLKLGDFKLNKVNLYQNDWYGLKLIMKELRNIDEQSSSSE